MKDDINERAVAITKELTDKGKIIEAGFASLMVMAYPGGVPIDQRAELRNAFFAGAHHLMSSMLAVMDEDREPTENDLRRVSLIQNELDDFLNAFKEKHFSFGQKGRA